MTKASRGRGFPAPVMFNQDNVFEGPQRGHKIKIRGKGNCEIKQSRLFIEERTGHKYFRIVAIDSEGSHYSTQLPTEVLQHTGWSWSDSPVPFELELDRDEYDWHVVDIDSQLEIDIRAPNASNAVALVVSNNAGLGDNLLVHPVHRMSLRMSGKRWIASMRRIIQQGSGPLEDCFTHPLSQVTAKAPFTRLSRRDVIQFGQEIDDVLEKYMPGGISWPVLGQGVLMCSHCFKRIDRREPMSCGSECDCE
mgnify:CR=1 FL=1|tara:strand:- start:938 stop:1687 length:750 start_codon:yes stop_codon:yes gene_type:complete